MCVRVCVFAHEWVVVRRITRSRARERERWNEVLEFEILVLPYNIMIKLQNENNQKST